jgi:hypothetical protein
MPKADPPRGSWPNSFLPGMNLNIFNDRIWEGHKCIQEVKESKGLTGKTEDCINCFKIITLGC